MGSESGRPDERPVHTLEIAPLRVAIAPVTNREYAAFLGTGHELPRFWAEERFNAPEQPVVGVNWFDAVAYCEWLAGEIGMKCRLPTEGEREYASLGGLRGVDWPWPGGRWQDHPNATELGRRGPPPRAYAELCERLRPALRGGERARVVPRLVLRRWLRTRSPQRRSETARTGAESESRGQLAACGEIHPP